MNLCDETKQIERGDFMNVVLWILQIILAIMFIIAGSMKSLNYEKALESLAWVKDSSRSFVTFVGVAELLGGIGLILPQALDIYQLLTPIAAMGADGWATMILTVVTMFVGIFATFSLE